jgi:hypothetical protein
MEAQIVAAVPHVEDAKISEENAKPVKNKRAKKLAPAETESLP